MALSVALGGVLVVDPFSVLGVSLWLSFGAVTVLAFGMMGRSHDQGAYGPAAIWWRWGRAQFLATIGLAPIVIASFDQQPLLSPLANAVANTLLFGAFLYFALSHIRGASPLEPAEGRGSEVAAA